MRMPTRKMASARLSLLGHYHVACIMQAEETRPLEPVFSPVLQALDASATATVNARMAMIGPQVQVAFAEASLEQTLRGVSLRAQQLDNKADGGPAKTAVFPDGLMPVLTPRGDAQIAAAGAVRDRVTTQPAAAPLRAEALPLIDAGVEALRVALAARAAAQQAFAAAFAAELGAREAFLSAYSSDAGAIRQLFPRDRARQELFFDSPVNTRRTPEELEEDDGDDEDEDDPTS